MNRNHQPTSQLSVARFATVALTLLFVFALFVPTLSAQQATPGTVIGNQASATYLDASSVSRQSFSNLVQTNVTQIYSATLTNTQTRYATVGTQVVFPHTYTNTGNGNDTVSLALGTISANLTNTAIYIDANGDGIPDNTTNIAGTSYTVGAGQTFKFVVVGTLIAGSTSGTSYSMTVTPTSGHGVVAPTTNVDTIIATSNAAISVTKSMSATSGAPGYTPLAVTLTYTNTGNATSGAVVIADPLGSNFTYIASSGKLNGATLTDGSGGWVVTGNTPTLTIPSIAPGVTGTITFNVTVSASAAVGSTLTNTANFAYNDGTTQIPATGSINTNGATFSITQTAGVAWTAGDPSDFTASAPNGTDALGAKTVGQGGTITWTDTLTNTGNGYDTFNITPGVSTFPAGTTFQFYRVDGVTPLTDSNGDGIIDSGPVAAGGTATIKVTATLPTSTVVTSTAYSLKVIATSTATTASNFASVAAATDTDTVTVTITSSSVDLTVTASANTGAEPGKGSGIASGVTNTVAPGQQTIFPFFVQNTSTTTGTADSYNLTVQSYTTAGNVTPTVAGTAVPNGWTVLIHQAASGATTCPASYAAQIAAVTNTPALAAAAGANANASWNLYCVEIDVPAGSAAATNDFIVTASSNSTAAVDQMTFAVTVSAVNAVTISPNQSGQVYAGGTIAYTHVITNGGNTSQTISFPSATAIVFTPSTGWSGVLYQNTDASGALDNASVAVNPGTTTITLAGGASALVFFKVQSSPAANPGDNSSATLTISYNGGTLATVTDVTTVISGQVKLVKSQYVDTGCTKTPGTYTTLSASATSGQCIIYQIVATNTGQTNVTGLTIADAAPPYTTYLTGYTTTTANTCSLTGGTVTVTGGGTAGFTAAFTGSMTPSCTATITFEVKLN